MDNADCGRPWYVRRYRAKGSFVHVVGPDDVVFILTLAEAKTLGQKLLDASSIGSYDHRA